VHLVGFIIRTTTISNTALIYKTKICISKRNVPTYAAQKVLDLPSEKIAWITYRIAAATLGVAIEYETV